MFGEKTDAEQAVLFYFCINKERGTKELRRMQRNVFTTAVIPFD